MAYVYILYSEEQDTYYIGSTLRIEERLEHHAKGYTPSTKHLYKQSLALSQWYSTLEEARKIEKRLKNLKRRDYLEKIIGDGFIKMKP